MKTHFSSSVANFLLFCNYVMFLPIFIRLLNTGDSFLLLFFFLKKKNMFVERKASKQWTMKLTQRHGHLLSQAVSSQIVYN